MDDILPIVGLAFVLAVVDAVLLWLGIKLLDRDNARNTVPITLGVAVVFAALSAFPSMIPREAAVLFILLVVVYKLRLDKALLLTAVLTAVNFGLKALLGYELFWF
jgi:hypothetical protein